MTAVSRQVIAQVLRYQSAPSAALSADGTLLGLTASFADLLGVTTQAAEGQAFERFLTAHDAVRLRPHLTATGREIAVLDVTLGAADAAAVSAVRLWLRWTTIGDRILLVVAVPLRDARLVEQFRDAAALGVVVAERTATLERALAEKDRALAMNQALLREVHHRVKNNLQMLCDMLYLQMEGLGEGEKSAVLRETYGRIYAIARLHEQLYQSMESGQVQLGAYLRRLVTGFEDLYPTVPIRLETPDDPRLDVDRAIHVGLIVNELVTNALKHAFPEGGGGEVVVGVRQLGAQVTLEVRDNGKGLPPHLDLGQAKSLGLRIVRILGQRLEATVTMATHGGACITLTFPLDADRPIEPRG